MAIAPASPERIAGERCMFACTPTTPRLTLRNISRRLTRHILPEGRLMFKRMLVVAGTLILIAGSIIGAWGQIPPAQHYESSSAYAPCIVLCRINFSMTPSTSRVLIRSVSCFIESSVPITQMALGAATATSGGIIKRIYFGAIPQVVEFVYLYSFSTDVYFYVGQSRIPFINLGARSSGTVNATCSVSGDYETP